MKRGNLKRKISGIGGWLLIIVLDFIFSTVMSLVLFIQKINKIISGSAQTGVYISAILILPYLIFLVITLFLLLKKRKSAIKTFIFAAIFGAVFLIWYYLVAQILYNPDYAGQIAFELIFTIVNITITVIIAVYLFKSERVKNTLKLS